MGTVYAEIALKNAGDRIKVRDGLLPEKEIRQTEVMCFIV
jgi:hypothetical protein